MYLTNHKYQVTQPLFRIVIQLQVNRAIPFWELGLLLAQQHSKCLEIDKTSIPTFIFLPWAKCSKYYFLVVFVCIWRREFFIGSLTWIKTLVICLPVSTSQCDLIFIKMSRNISEFVPMIKWQKRQKVIPETFLKIQPNIL